LHNQNLLKGDLKKGGGDEIDIIFRANSQLFQYEATPHGGSEAEREFIFCMIEFALLRCAQNKKKEVFRVKFCSETFLSHIEHL